MSDCYPERFTRAYVYEQTAERVELHFRNNVTVRHVTNKGCILLAVLWAKILQHRGNFPNHIYRYDRTHHQVTGHELLRVHIPDTEITFTVTMATGLLTIEGLDVFRWFRNKFLDLLKNYDEELYNKLHPLPPLTPKKSRKFEKKETPGRLKKQTKKLGDVDAWGHYITVVNGNGLSPIRFQVIIPHDPCKAT